MDGLAQGMVVGSGLPGAVLEAQGPGMTWG